MAKIISHALLINSSLVYEAPQHEDKRDEQNLGERHFLFDVFL